MSRGRLTSIAVALLLLAVVGVATVRFVPGYLAKLGDLAEARGVLVEAYPGEAIALSRTGEEHAIVLVVTWINSERAAEAPDRVALAREIAGRAYSAFAEREAVTAVNVAFRVEDDKVLYERFRDETHRFEAAELAAAILPPGEGQ
ncbi:hypothetical protein ABI59_10585 [Acidobacteria bacterium Mor1]|nr:hypothetical protein ABI59_10585 [Acidobacteria bacterium Mor1]